MVKLTVSFEEIDKKKIGMTQIDVIDKIQVYIKDLDIIPLPMDQNGAKAKGLLTGGFACDIADKQSLKMILNMLCSWQKEKQELRKVKIKLDLRDKHMELVISSRNPDCMDKINNWIEGLKL